MFRKTTLGSGRTGCGAYSCHFLDVALANAAYSVSLNTSTGYKTFSTVLLG